MEVNQTIYQKALDIVNKDKILKQYLLCCKNANICPKCGEHLIVRGYADFHENEKNRNIYQIKECSYVTSHYNETSYYNVDDD